jgi:TetR/AcrR family transcriptional repressor of mexJK operon
VTGSRTVNVNPVRASKSAAWRRRSSRFRSSGLPSDRFPDVGRSWYEQGFERVLTRLSMAFSKLDEANRLHVDDPETAAHHFVGMLLWIPLNKAMFTGDDTAPSAEHTASYANAATRTFLAAYGTTTTN